MRFLLALMLAGLTLSCVSYDKGPKTFEEVLAGVTIVHDQYKGTTWVTGPTVPWNDRSTWWKLRSLYVGDSSEPQAVQLYIEDVPPGGDWAFYENASDKEGHRFEVTVIDRDAVAISYSAVCVETIAVELGMEYLIAHEKRLINLKIWGTHGERTVWVPRWYSAAYLQRLREFADGR